MTCWIFFASEAGNPRFSRRESRPPASGYPGGHMEASLGSFTHVLDFPAVFADKRRNRKRPSSDFA